MQIFQTRGIVTIALGALGALAAACSGSGSTAGSGGTGGATASSSAGTGASSSSAGTGASSSSSGTGGSPASATFVAHFDPTMGQLPEGLYVDGSTAFVGWAALSKIVKVALPAGTVSDFGTIPALPMGTMNGGFMLGIALDSTKNAYVGFGGGTGTVVKNGVYKLPAAGGAATMPWAADPTMNFPNGLFIDATDTVWVADSGGTIFKIAKDATVTKWISDPSITASGTCMFAAPFPIGANGLVKGASSFFVSNTNVGQIVEIPIKADGSAGTPTILAGPDCNALGGIDGIALDADGSIIAVINAQQKLVRVSKDGKTITVLTSGMPLDNPASVSVATVAGKKAAYFTNSSFFDTTAPAPGLLEYPLP